MAAPSVGTTGSFGATATLASTTLSATPAGKIKVTGLTIGGSFQDAEFRDGAGTVLGEQSYGAVKTLSIDFLFAGTDCPEPPPKEEVTVSSATDARANGKWAVAAMVNRGCAAGDFTKYTLQLKQGLDVDCVTVLWPSQS